MAAPLLLVLLPAAALASEGHAEGIPWSFLGFHTLNLLLLLGLIFWLAGRAISDALKNRSALVRRAILDAQEAKESAEARLAALEERLAHFEEESRRLVDETRRAAEGERERLLERARQEAAAIRAAAERAVQEELRRARRRLQEETVALALELAEELLRRELSPEDRARFADELVAAIEREGRDLGGGAGGPHEH